MSCSSRQGFTLLELSIVIVVIALIIGGIMAGDSLTRAGKLQAVMSDISRYQQAIQNFKDKYHELPGDMPNAESFWGSDASCPNTTSNTVLKTATCNGDGNGTIGGCESGTTCNAPTNIYEWFRAWQQLADAGMIDGAYSGVLGPLGSQNAVVGTNVPASKMKNVGYTLRYFKDSAGDGNYYPGAYGHIIHFGLESDANYTYYPILTAAEALNIDTKQDDGLPAYGKVMAQPPSNAKVPNCTTSATPASASYNTSYSYDACSLIFVLPF